MLLHVQHHSRLQQLVVRSVEDWLEQSDILRNSRHLRGNARYGDPILIGLGGIAELALAIDDSECEGGRLDCELRMAKQTNLFKPSIGKHWIRHEGRLFLLLHGSGIDRGASVVVPSHRKCKPRLFDDA
jgi:hypothetical protein